MTFPFFSFVCKDGQTAFAVAQNDACRAPIKAAMDAKAAALRFEAMTKQGVQLNKFIVSNSIELAESLLEKQIGKFPELLMFEEEPVRIFCFVYVCRRYDACTGETDYFLPILSGCIVAV